jgi:hypothetical protein
MEVRFEEFVGRDMWAAVTRGLSKEERSALKAPLVYQEVRPSAHITHHTAVWRCCAASGR